MQLSQILFIAFGAITVGAALVVVTRRDLFHAALALIVSCMGVAGLLALLEAPIVAVLQLLVYAGGVAILIKANPLPAGVTRAAALGVSSRWWAAALVAAALCGILSWVALTHVQDTVPIDSAAALGIAPADLPEFVLPLAAAVMLLAAAIVGAVQIVRRR